MMHRRLFLQALAASVVAAGAVLPMGFPKEAREPWYWYALVDGDGFAHGHMTANHPYHLSPGAAPARRLSKSQHDQLVLEFQQRAAIREGLQA